MCQVTSKNGRRWSAADAYLRPARRRPNLDDPTGAQVAGLEMDGAEPPASGGRDRRGRESTAARGREVILCAGSIGSPQLLMLSGIGPAEHLRDAGIEPRVDLPGVGENLQDHPYVICIFESTVNEDLADAEEPRALAEYPLRPQRAAHLEHRRGPAFIRTRPGLPAADVQILFGAGLLPRRTASTTHDGHAFSIGARLIAPKSRGRLRLRSADPTAKPVLVGNHLDRARGRGVAGRRHQARPTRSRATEPLASAFSALARARRPASTTDAEIEAFAREEAELLYHPVGTCRMGDGRRRRRRSPAPRAGGRGAPRRRRIGHAGDHRAATPTPRRS